jgi:hypothetical protein
MSYNVTEQLSWGGCDALVESYASVIVEQYEELLLLLSRWDSELALLGKDSTHIDWNSFHVLRLSREEDWSDWLGFLIAQSNTGVFAQSLFGETARASELASPTKVEREVPYGQYRADLIVQWSDAKYSHIEVKVGDYNLSKTYATSKAMQSKYNQTSENWADHILLLSSQMTEWEAVAQKDNRTIGVLTWEDVAVSLRRALRSEESVLWKAWAYSFTGAIEQLLLGYSGHKLRERPFANVETKIAILKKGFEDDDRS